MNVVEIIRALRMNHNVVLEGVPGVGKSYAVWEIKEHWERLCGRRLIEGAGQGKYAITMHPALAYEDFIEGLRPRATVGESSSAGSGAPSFFCEDYQQEETSENTQFVVQKGSFLRACTEAVKNPEQDVLILLDEINRANVPKVLGDLLSTLETAKRAKWNGKRWLHEQAEVVSLPYSGRRFFVPDNVYILATMNTSDRSIAPFDAALRRRFSFVRLEPKAKGVLADELGELLDVGQTQFEESLEIWHQLNEHVLRPCLGPDAVLGHSYFYQLAERLKETQNNQLDLETASLFEDLGRGETEDGRSITKAFWIETGAMTSQTGNQLDLVRSGKQQDKGMLDFFISNSDTVDPETGILIDVRFDGQLYKGNKVWFPQDNRTWRVNLNGQLSNDPTNDLTSVAKNDTFKRSVISFCQIGQRTYQMRVHPKRVLEDFEFRSTWHDTSKAPPAVSRKFGCFDVSRGVHGGDSLRYSVNDLIYMTWRYQLLPQLADALTAHRAENLFSASEREAWFSGRAGLETVRADAIQTLDRLKSFLRGMNLQLVVEGEALGRKAYVRDAEASASIEPPTTGEDAEQPGAVPAEQTEESHSEQQS